MASVQIWYHPDRLSGLPDQLVKIEWCFDRFFSTDQIMSDSSFRPLVILWLSTCTRICASSWVLDHFLVLQNIVLRVASSRSQWYLPWYLPSKHWGFSLLQGPKCDGTTPQYALFSHDKLDFGWVILRYVNRIAGWVLDGRFGIFPKSHMIVGATRLLP